MAEPARVILEHIPGAFYIDDDSCIDCDSCRCIAPETFGAADGRAVVLAQPAGEEQIEAALEAMDSCPVQAVGRHPEVHPAGNHRMFKGG